MEGHRDIQAWCRTSGLGDAWTFAAVAGGRFDLSCEPLGPVPDEDTHILAGHRVVKEKDLHNIRVQMQLPASAGPILHSPTIVTAVVSWPDSACLYVKLAEEAGVAKAW